MNTLTLKISPMLEQQLRRMSEQTGLSKSELVRRALQAFLTQFNAVSPFVSALDQAGDLVACFSGGSADLSSNPEYLKDFGRV